VTVLFSLYSKSGLLIRCWSHRLHDEHHLLCFINYFGKTWGCDRGKIITKQIIL